MNDLIEQYIKELKENEKGFTPFVKVLAKKAEELNWTPDNELMQLLFFALDLNSAAFAYHRAKENGTPMICEIRQGLSDICTQTMAGIFCEIKNNGSDRWRNFGKKREMSENGESK